MKYKLTKVLEYYDIPVTVSATFKLADDCRNGVCDFSITGHFHDISGCCHEEIARHFPELKTFIPLHLSNEFGQPMYPVDNFIFHIRQCLPDEKIMELYRCNEQQLSDLRNAVHDKDYFKYVLYKTGLIAKWKQDADVAIKWLEEKTGGKFTYTESPKFTLEYPDEWLQQMEQRVQSGEFSSKAMAEKAKVELEEWQKREIYRIEREHELSSKFINRRREIELWITNNIPSQNYFFFAYNGTGHREEPLYELEINKSTWKSKMPKDDFDKFIELPDVPKDLKIIFH